jgi:eukaryotic-like serine/threonine-protein kinase
MPLAIGSRLGPYEIRELLGAGGMGEVYRATDTRLGRDVAIKALAPHALQDSASRARFEQEGRAVAALNHPNIVAVYDVGESYIVWELVEGTTLKQAGQLPLRRALEITAQVADGLGTAHASGIVHRDIKPENIMVARDGVAKILDFGIAKRTGLPSGAPLQTQAGFVIGTAAYMSPEQVRGEPVDPRTDIFSLGLVLYEMLSGRRAFCGETPLETMNAIVREDPPELPASVPAPVRLLIHSCLEKDRERRFTSARDLAVVLRALSGGTQTAPIESGAPAPVKKRLRSAGMWALSMVIAVLVGLAASRLLPRAPIPTFRQVTFQRGFVSSARLSGDGQQIVYSAQWHSDALDLFAANLNAPEARPLGYRGAHLFSVSRHDELALGMDVRFEGDNSQSATLAVVPLQGGSPRIVSANVTEADWDPEGKDLAIVRRAGRTDRLEYPIGKVLYETAGWLGDLRFSRRGERIAFSEHPLDGDDRGWIAVVDRTGRQSRVSPHWDTIQGLAWSRNGEEIWYAASQTDDADTLYAVKPGRQYRVVARFAGGVHLEDIAADGRILFSRADEDRSEMYVRMPDEPHGRALDWLGSSYPVSLSNDGKLLLFSQYGQASAKDYASYLWKLDGSAPVRLGTGDPSCLSPDGKSVLAIVGENPQRLVLLPAEAGSARVLPDTGLSYLQAAEWLPDGERVLIAGNRPGRRVQLWTMRLSGGQPEPVSLEGVSFEGSAVSPDGRSVVASGPEGLLRVYPISSGDSREIAGVTAADRFVRWRPDGRRILIANRSGLPVRLFELDLTSGERKRVADFTPADPTGVTEITQVLVDATGSTIVYGQNRRIRTLYLSDGLR